VIIYFLKFFPAEIILRALIWGKEFGILSPDCVYLPLFIEDA
jgi:hypothetical protein